MPEPGLFIKRAEPSRALVGWAVGPCRVAWPIPTPNGCLWLIGNDSKVHFWTDNWLGYLIADRLQIPDYVRKNLKSTVGDYLFGGTWHFTSYFFTHHIDVVIDILQTPVHPSDQRIWPSSAKGSFTAKIAYDLLRSPLLRMNWAPWIWAPFIPQIRSTVVWRAIWGKLPTSDKFHQIGLAGPTRCPLCLSASETQDHILSECRFSRSILSSISDIFNVTLYYDQGFSSLVIQAHAIVRNSQVGNLWRLTFITSIWAIWHLRCRAIFDDLHPTTRGGLILIRGLIMEAKHFKLGTMHGVADLAVCHKLGVPCIPRPEKTTTIVRWLPPPPGFYKINVDGSTHNGKIYAGCIIRNSLGYFIAGFSISLGRGIALDAKILAGMHGIIFARARGWNQIWLESDNELAIKVLVCDGKSIP